MDTAMIKTSQMPCSHIAINTISLQQMGQVLFLTRNLMIFMITQMIGLAIAEEGFSSKQVIHRELIKTTSKAPMQSRSDLSQPGRNKTHVATKSMGTRHTSSSLQHTLETSIQLKWRSITQSGLIFSVSKALNTQNVLRRHLLSQ